MSFDKQHVMRAAASASELLPCPFCGSTAVLIAARASMLMGRCGFCYAAGPQKHGAEAVAAWNARAALEASSRQEERLAKLRDVLLGIEIYAQDTLSGEANPADSRERWYADGIREIRNRARAALEPPHAKDAADV